jgi:hypothetical protein
VSFRRAGAQGLLRRAESSRSLFIRDGSDFTRRAARRRERVGLFCFFHARFPQAHDLFDGAAFDQRDEVRAASVALFRLFQRYVADLPEGFKEGEKFDETADAAIALYKYSGGIPFCRQARMHLMNFIIFATQISVRQNRHCHNLDAELIEYQPLCPRCR